MCYFQFHFQDDLNQNQISLNDNASQIVEFNSSKIVDIDSLSPRSDEPASIEQLVMGAEDLVIMRRRHNVGNRMVRSVSYTKTGVVNKTTRAVESDHDDVYEDDGMDCRRDDPRRSMHSSSSFSQMIDSLIVQVEEKTTSESDVDEHHLDDVTDTVGLKRRHDEDGSSCYSDEDFRLNYEEQEEEDEEDEDEDEEAEISEYWDQVRFCFFIVSTNALLGDLMN
jgi:hypothetical protein